MFDLLLFGILTAQAYIYYISFPGDRVLLKIAVVWVYLAGVAQTCVALLDFQNQTLLIRIFFNDVDTAGSVVTAYPGGPDHLWLSITALTAPVATVIQSLYAYRIYLISKKRWLAIVIICMSLGQLASGILGAICYWDTTQGLFQTFFHPAFGAEPEEEFKFHDVCNIGFNWIWGPINITCDLTITVCMVTFLIKHRKRTMVHQTRSHITKIIQLVVETGMASAVLTIAYTVLNCLWSSRRLAVFVISWHPLPGLMMSKVYSNSMLVLLNNRATIDKGRNAVESFEFVEVSGRGLENDFQLRTRGRSSNDSTPAQS